MALQTFKSTQLRQALTWWGTIYSNYKVESKLYQSLFAGVCLNSLHTLSSKDGGSGV